MPVLQIVNTRRHQKTGCKEGADADFLWISPFCSLVLLPLTLISVVVFTEKMLRHHCGTFFTDVVIHQK